MQKDRTTHGATNAEPAMKQQMMGEASFSPGPGNVNIIAPSDSSGIPYAMATDGSLPSIVGARTPERRSFGRNAWLIALAVLAAAVIPTALFSNYHLFQLTMVVVYAIAILGLAILSGFNGQISLGHGAFYAIGAYVTAILMS